MDVFDPEKRSEIMRRVKGRDTTPELLVRRLVHRMGYRFRLHRTDLPGKPDLVFPGRRKIIFVHGCFWHGHTCRRGRNRPNTRREYWDRKLDRNKERDQQTTRRLRRMGWGVLIVWECQLRPKKLDVTLKRIQRFLDRE